MAALPLGYVGTRRNLQGGGPAFAQQIVRLGFRRLSGEFGGRVSGGSRGGSPGRSGFVQVSGIIDQIKNIGTRHRTPGGPQDVGEREAALVPVPGTQGRGGELALAGPLQEP